MHSRTELDDLIFLLSTGLPHRRFSPTTRIVCHFQFPAADWLFEKVAYSNSVPVSGGEVRLTKRIMQSSEDACVLGIALTGCKLWLLRATSLDHPRVIDIMAGSTKSDSLRVPNASKGTWTDLFPVSPDLAFDGPLLFILEYQ